MTSAFCLFVFETFVSRLLALFGTIITSESGNPTRPGDKWERKLLVFGIFYSFLTSGRPLSSSTVISLTILWKPRLQAMRSNLIIYNVHVQSYCAISQLLKQEGNLVSLAFIKTSWISLLGTHY